MGDQPVAMPLSRWDITNTDERQTTMYTMPEVGIEYTTSVFERTKTVYALQRAATVIGEAPTW
jgi:hypothetical protein